MVNHHLLNVKVVRYSFSPLKDILDMRYYAAAQVFQLSKKEGINLEIQYGFSKTDLHMIYNQLLILPYKPCWRVLHSGPSCIQAVFGSDRSFPLTSLEELIIEQRNMLEHRLRSLSFNSAPNLKRLIVSILGKFSTQQVIAPWKNLVSLNLDTKGSSCDTVLTQCFRLEACILGFTGRFWPKEASTLVNSPGYPYFVVIRRSTLRQLETLTLSIKHVDILFLSLLVGAKRTYKNVGINILLSKTLLIMAMKAFLYSKLDLMMFGIGSQLPN